MILTEALFAPTVPSEPSPKKTAWTSPAGRAMPEVAVDRQAEVGDVVVDADREVALRVARAASSSKIGLIIDGVISLDDRP